MVIEKLVCLFMLSVRTSLFTKLRNLLDVGGKKHTLGTGWGNHKNKNSRGGDGGACKINTTLSYATNLGVRQSGRLLEVVR